MTADAERIKLVSDDITQLRVDAIVNAANRSLLGGEMCIRDRLDGGRGRAAGGGVAQSNALSGG